MYYDITGMTFSGHPFTTYFNTSASLAYGSFYLYNSELHRCRHFMWAAGDDLVIWHVRDISECILQHTSRSKDKDNVGLGQCVKEVIVSNYDDYDFCSKWVF